MEISDNTKKYFTRHLMAWHSAENARTLPWKSEKDPYKIWLSEVILQQTRALQGLPYYLTFTGQYPTVSDLAAASDEEAFRLWQGLGYYNRCKNMLATARYITNELDNEFPKTYEGLISLKGIGPYTAAAISSFAYGSPHAVVDGNVFRVLSRYFGIDTPYDTTEGKRIFSALAQELLDAKDSAAYNQGIMDLGATICAPQNPQCETCPVNKNCMAFEQGLIDILPVKSKKLIIRKRYFNYLLLKWNDTIWIHKRTGRDIWENLHEPFLVESDEQIDIEKIIQNDILKIENISYSSITYKGCSSQRLTHRIIEARFYEVVLTKKPKIGSFKGNWLDMNGLKKTAFPKTVVSFLENNLYFSIP